MSRNVCRRVVRCNFRRPRVGEPTFEPSALFAFANGDGSANVGLQAGVVEQIVINPDRRKAVWDHEFARRV